MEYVLPVVSGAISCVLAVIVIEVTQVFTDRKRREIMLHRKDTEGWTGVLRHALGR